MRNKSVDSVPSPASPASLYHGCMSPCLHVCNGRTDTQVQLWKSTAATAVATNPHVQQGLRSQLKKRKAGEIMAKGAVAAVAAPAKKRTYAELERALYFAEKQIRKLKKQVEQLKRANGTL